MGGGNLRNQEYTLRVLVNEITSERKQKKRSMLQQSTTLPCLPPTCARQRTKPGTLGKPGVNENEQNKCDNEKGGQKGKRGGGGEGEIKREVKQTQ